MAVALLALAGCRPSFSSERRDGGSAPPYVGSDAGSPIAPSPIQCVGTPPPCAGRNEYDCVAGCELNACTGTPRACAQLPSSRECLMEAGCTWTTGDVYDACVGTPATPCAAFRDYGNCGAHGCNWQPSATSCVGTPWPCSLLDAYGCERFTGCYSPTASDGGAPWCSSAGECNPFAPGSCGASKECIVDDANGSLCIPVRTEGFIQGSSCDVPTDCGRGLDCTEVSGGQGCLFPCPAGSIGQCGVDSRCAFDPTDPGGCVGHCYYAGPECDHVRQDCGAGDACYFWVDPETDEPRTRCSWAGSTAVGGACSYHEDCVAGTSCIGRKCMKFCRTDADCTGGRTCTYYVEGAPEFKLCGP